MPLNKLTELSSPPLSYSENAGVLKTTLHIQTTSTCTKRCSVSLVIRKVQIKKNIVRSNCNTHQDDYYERKKEKNTGYRDQNTEKVEPLHTVGVSFK